MVHRISSQLQPQAAPAKQKQATGGPSFESLMREQLNKQERVQQNVEFSKHAMSRVQERGIEITPQLMNQLQGGLERAQEKGATNVLAMDAETAFLINVPRARVITAITQEEMKENIFTNIDGAVFL